MSPVLVAGVCTWRDGFLLAEAVRAARPHVDAVIVLDGGYDHPGYDYGDDDRWTPTAHLLAAREAGAILYPAKWATPGGGTLTDPDPDVYLRSEAAKRAALLDLAGRHAARLEPDAPAWLLQLDADDLLVHGAGLRGELVAVPPDRVAYPLPRVEPDGRVYAAPTRCVRTWAKPTGCHWLVRDGAGRLVSLSHLAFRGPLLPGFPFLRHRRHLRPAARRDARAAWGTELDRAGLDELRDEPRSDLAAEWGPLPGEPT